MRISEHKISFIQQKMHKISQSIRIKVPCAELFHPNQAEQDLGDSYYSSSRIWQILRILQILQILQILRILRILRILQILQIRILRILRISQQEQIGVCKVLQGPYLPFPNYIMAKYLKKNYLFLLQFFFNANSLNTLFF